MSFFQIIELTTTRPDAVEALTNRWAASTQGRRKTCRATLSRDRDRPHAFVQIVEFASYEEAMENSDLPETAQFADDLAKLCDAPPTFHNLDLRCVYDL